MNVIVLAGMPASGKTTVGKLLSERLCRPFIDLDAEIVKYAGRSIPEIFAEGGESLFRNIETEVVRKISPISGAVIATGGGVVTRARNLPLMSQNGRVLFLDTPPDSLPTAGRPLSQTKTPAVLYAERLPLYRAAADITVPITRDIESNMQRIKEALQ